MVVIDPAAGTVVGSLAVGKRPRGLRVLDDGQRVFVALSGSPIAGPGVDESKLPPADRKADGIGMVDLKAMQVARVLRSGQDPESFALSLDEKTAYVSNEDAAEMSVVDVASGEIRARVPVGEEPEGVRMRPDGKVVYVTCEGDNSVVAVDTATLKEIARVKTGARPRDIAFTRDGASRSSRPRTAEWSPCLTSRRIEYHDDRLAAPGRRARSAPSHGHGDVTDGQTHVSTAGQVDLRDRCRVAQGHADDRRRRRPSMGSVAPWSCSTPRTAVRDCPYTQRRTGVHDCRRRVRETPSR